MRPPKPALAGATLAALLALSGFAWLPVPLAFAQRELAERSPGFRVAGRAALRWATGELRVREAALSWKDAELCRAAGIGVRVDLRPWRGLDAPVARIEVFDGSFALDEEALRALLAPGRDRAGRPAAFELRIRDVAGTLRDRADRTWSVAGATGRVVGAYEGALGYQIRAEATARFVTPAAASVAVRLRVAPRADDWEIGLALEATDLPPPERLGLDLGGLSWIRADARGRALLGPGAWLFAGELEARTLRLARMDATVDLLRLEAAGDAGRRIRCSGEAATAHGSVLLDGWLTRSAPAAGPPVGADGWTLDLAARAPGFACDPALRAALTRAAPEAAEVLTALDPHGSAAGALRLQARLERGAPPPAWCAVADAAGLGLRYFGFRDRESDRRLGLPAPVAVSNGRFVATSGGLCFVATGAVPFAVADAGGGGEAPAAAQGAIRWRPGEADLWLDFALRDLPVDQRIAELAAAQPGLAEAWRELGVPRAERAEFGLTLTPRERSLDLRFRFSAVELLLEPPRVGLALRLPLLSALGDAQGVELRGELQADGVAGRFLARAERDATVVGTAAAVAEWDGMFGFEGSGLPGRALLARIAEAGLDPGALDGLELSGDCAWTVAARGRLDAEGRPLASPSWLASADLDGGSLGWPERRLALAGLALHGAIAGGAGGATAHLASAAGDWSGGRVRASLSTFLPGDDGDPPGQATLAVADAALEDEVLREILAPLGVQSWTARMRVGGRISAQATVPLADPERATVRLDLLPLQLELPAGALQRAARREATAFEIRGRIRAVSGRLDADGLQMAGPGLDLELRECAGSFDPSGLRLGGRAVSAKGLSLRPPLGLVAPQRLLDSLDQIGLDGVVAPRDLRFELDLPSAGAPLVRMHGTADLSEFRIAGPPAVVKGAGSVRCVDFVWRGPEDFAGLFELSEGSARVAGVAASGASGRLELRPDRVIVTRFDAAALGGRATTEWPEGTEPPRRGAFELGLAGRAEIRAEFRFEDFQLERLGEEIGFRGPLAGRLSGEVALRSPEPSPIQYKGRVDLDIRDGVLGTVPVLAQIWRLLGVETPTFSDGQLRMNFLGGGRILVDALSLKHALLEVTGERMVTMDSYLGLKVTVRTFGLLGRLPLVRDLLDLLVEHDVYGPASAPRLRQRGLGKLFAGDTDRVPFPLWVPRVARPDWSKSPALPVGGPALQTPALPHP